jgi:hypothetical protein
MFWKKVIIIISLAIATTTFTFGQNRLTTYFSPGYINHFGNGYNIELGFDYEVFKFFGVSVNYRHAATFGQGADEVNMSNIQ